MCSKISKAGAKSSICSAIVNSCSSIQRTPLLELCSLNFYHRLTHKLLTQLPLPKTTVLDNPNLSGRSTSSSESKPEPCINVLSTRSFLSSIVATSSLIRSSASPSSFPFPPLFQFDPLLFLRSYSLAPFRTLLTIAGETKEIQDDDEQTANRHAAQIFAEMLGQVCHPEFYEEMENQYQEVLPIPLIPVIPSIAFLYTTKIISPILR